MLTCKEASFLASKKLDKKLTFRERIEFFLHTAMCSLCRHYAKEIEVVDKLMQKVAKSEEAAIFSGEKLSEQARERIQQAIDKVLHSIK